MEDLLENLSQLTIVVPIIEAANKKELITGDRITDDEADGKIFNATIQLGTVGGGAIASRGVGALRMIAVSAAGDITATTVSVTGERLQLPPGLTMTLSILSAYGVQNGMIKTFKTPGGRTIEIGNVESVADASKGGKYSDSYLFYKYKEILVKDDVLNNSYKIIEGKDFGDQKLIKELTKDGSNIKNWAKMESLYTYTNEYGSGEIHYYYNEVTGAVSYYDCKMKISVPKNLRGNLKCTTCDKGNFWILKLDENMIPIGVREW